MKLYRLIPVRLWTRECDGRGCSERSFHTAHLTRLGRLALR